MKNLNPRKFGRRYPWAVWFATSSVTLKRGVDYTCRTGSMLQMIYQNARELNVSVGVEVAEDERSLTLFRKE